MLLHDVTQQSWKGEEVLAGGNLRHNAAESRMNVRLRGEAMNDDAPTIFDNGDAGFVAGRLDAEDSHGSAATTRTIAVGAWAVQAAFSCSINMANSPSSPAKR